MNPISNEMIAELEALLGGNKVLKGDAIGADFAHDELPGGKFCVPALVCEAASTEDVAAVLTVCNREAVPVTVRGAGTGLVGGSVPVCGGVVLSLAKMNAILELDSEKKTARVQPGVLLETLKAEAAAKGLYYPPDPGEKTATIGGNAATNAGGPSAVKYGVTRDYVRGATVVLPTGEVLQLGGATGKDNSGYRLLPLVLGSEGTLGVITELTLRLVEKPKTDVSLILPFLDGESCVNAALRILQEGMEPVALEYMDTDLVEFAGKATGNPVFPVEMDGERVGASLLLTLEGKDDDELDSKMEAVAELAEELECLDILVVDTPTLKRDVWGAHDAFHTAVEGAAKSADELNMAVPAAEMLHFAVRMCIISPAMQTLTAQESWKKEQEIYESNRYCEKDRRSRPRGHSQRDSPHHAHPRRRPVTDNIVTVGKVLSGYDADRPKSSFRFCIGLRSYFRLSHMVPLLIGIYGFTFPQI